MTAVELTGRLLNNKDNVGSFLGSFLATDREFSGSFPKGSEDYTMKEGTLDHFLANLPTLPGPGKDRLE